MRCGRKGSIMTEIGLLILGVFAGVLSGLFGIGGGIVMVPSLILFFGMDILDANAISLAAMLLPVGALGVWAYYKAGMIRIADSLWISAGLFLGSFVGGEFAVNISESLLAKLYAAILLYIALSYLDILTVLGIKKAGTKPTPQVAGAVRKPFWSFVLVGVAAGVFAGLFGKGGGLIIVPLLISIFHYEAKMATATSLAALQLPVGLPSVVIYAQNGHLNVLFAALIAAGIVVGTLAGTKVAVRLPAIMFKKAYALFLMAVAVFMVYKYI